MSFKINDLKKGHCIIIIDRNKGYNVYNCNYDEWCVSKNSTIKPDSNNARALLVTLSTKCIYTNIFTRKIAVHNSHNTVG